MFDNIINRLSNEERLMRNTPDSSILNKQSRERGVCVKHFVDGLFIKEDTNGYESLAEELSSRLLFFTNQPNIIEYRSILYNDFICSVSDNYVKEGYSEVTCLDLFGIKELSKLEGEEGFNTLCEGLLKVFSKDLSSELASMMISDALILNCDRHYGNISLLYKKDKSDIYLPYYDIGDALGSDITINTLDMSVIDVYNRSFGKPFDFRLINSVKWARSYVRYRVDEMGIKSCADMYCNELYSKEEMNRAKGLFELSFEKVMSLI